MNPVRVYQHQASGTYALLVAPVAKGALALSDCPQGPLGMAMGRVADLASVLDDAQLHMGHLRVTPEHGLAAQSSSVTGKVLVISGLRHGAPRNSLRSCDAQRKPQQQRSSRLQRRVRRSSPGCASKLHLRSMSPLAACIGLRRQLIECLRWPLDLPDVDAAAAPLVV